MSKAIELFVVQYRSRDFFDQWSDDAGWQNHTVFDCEQDANECVGRQCQMLNEWRVEKVPAGEDLAKRLAPKCPQCHGAGIEYATWENGGRGWVGCKACTTNIKEDGHQPNTDTKGGE